jgi:hypothetical protein
MPRHATVWASSETRIGVAPYATMKVDVRLRAAGALFSEAAVVVPTW